MRTDDLRETISSYADMMETENLVRNESSQPLVCL